MTEKFTITFAGDTSLGDWYLKNPNRKEESKRLDDDPLSYFRGVKSLVQSSDYFILNLETVLENNPAGFIEGKQYPNFDNPTRTLSILKELGVSAVSLANNHTMDFGSDVMLRTMNRLKKAGIQSFGAGKNSKKAVKPYKMELKGKRGKKNVYAITGMSASRRYREDYDFMARKNKPGVNSLGLKRITRRIRSIRKRDSEAIIIVCPHWQGIDYKWVTPKREKRCREFLKEGADFVFAHGTHMANHIEHNENGTIVYSMGNFIFNSPGRYKKMQAPPYSLIIQLQIQESNGKWTVEPQFYPIVTDNKLTNFNVRKVKPEENKELLDLLNSKSQNDSEMRLTNKESQGEQYLVFSKNVNGLTENIYPSGMNLKDVIMGNSTISNINFTSDEVFNDHVQQLGNLHSMLDANFYNYYEKLAYAKKVTSSRQRLKELSKVVKKEYLSHKFVKRFERKKLYINNAISFKEIMAEKSVMRRLGHKENAWKLDKKNKAYPFMESIGLRVPKSDPNIYKLSDLKEPSKPAVIKPTRSTGSAGVYLIFNKNTILSARSGKYFHSWDELQKDAFKRLKSWDKAKSGAVLKDEWMIEELILREKDSILPPSDLKFYCFYGEVFLVLESYRLHKKFCFWDAEMNLIDPYIGGEFFEGSGFTADHVKLVEEASSRIPTPFIRLDMLNGYDGIVFGEATPRPGQYHLFNHEYDRQLGEAYRMAEARLTRDLLNGKKFDEFTNHFKI